MSAVMEIYQLVKDLIDEAREQKNMELVEKLIDVKIAVNELKEENVELRKQLDTKESVIRHNEGQYITLKGDDSIKYCSTCWGQNGKLIQMSNERCFICDAKWREACSR